MSEYCQPCKEAGRGLVIAHYRGDPAHKIPPRCWDCRNGTKPHPLDAMKVEREAEEEVERALKQARKEVGQEETPTQEEKTMAERGNPCKECGKALRITNTCGYCKQCRKDPAIDAKARANRTGSTPRTATGGGRANPTSKRPKEAASVDGSNGVSEQEARLDKFWALLSPAEKAQALSSLFAIHS